jgi:hypothetical protein
MLAITVAWFNDRSICHRAAAALRIGSQDELRGIPIMGSS